MAANKYITTTTTAHHQSFATSNIQLVAVVVVIYAICLASVQFSATAATVADGSLANGTLNNKTIHKVEEEPQTPEVVPIVNLLNKAVKDTEQPQACDVSLNCTQPQQICLNGRCTCKPNFVWRNGACHRQDCSDDPHMCLQQDPNRYCESLAFFGYSHCVCRDNYIEDPLTLICRPKCVSDLKHLCEDVDSPNSLCNVYRCQCKANFRRNSATGECEPFRCDYDAQCWSEGDKYRTCVNGTCACTYEEDPITKRCMLKFTSIFKIKNYYSWHTERILLATIIFVPIIFYYCVVQNIRRTKSTVVAFRAPRPGEQFYSAQSAISIQSPKFNMMHKTGDGGGVEYINADEIKKVPLDTKTDPKGESVNILYQRFS